MRSVHTRNGVIIDGDDDDKNTVGDSPCLLFTLHFCEELPVEFLQWDKEYCEIEDYHSN